MKMQTTFHPLICSVVLLLFIIFASSSSLVSGQQQQLSTSTTNTLSGNNLISSSEAPPTTATTLNPEDDNDINNNNNTLEDKNKNKTLPPFNYTGYFIDPNAQFSTALRGLCRWTTSDSLCMGTVIPILMTTVCMLLALVYNCVITPQKGALMVVAAVRDSPLWPVSLESLGEEEISEIVNSSANLALKDLFPLLGLESLVTRAAALGLATLKDLLCANALAVRDIGIEVKEGRILARSLERIAVHAKKIVAEKRKNKKDRRFSVSNRRGSRFGGASPGLAAAFGLGLGGGGGGGGNSNNNGSNASSPLQFAESPMLDSTFSSRMASQLGGGAGGDNNYESPILFGGGGASSSNQTRFGASSLPSATAAAAAAAGGGGGGGSAEMLRPVASVASPMQSFNRRTNAASAASARERLDSAESESMPSAKSADEKGGGAEEEQQQQQQQPSGRIGAEKWRKLRQRFQAAAALNAIDRFLVQGAQNREQKGSNTEMMEDL